jgi:hypothetical protein
VNPAITAVRDQVAALLREAGRAPLSTEALAARMSCRPLEIHSHLRALERRAQARRSYSTDYLSVYWRWTGPVDRAIGAFEAALDVESGEVR